MATNKNKTTSTKGSELPVTDATGVGSIDGKLLRTIRRAGDFFNVIGQEPDKLKRVRGRIGGEMPKDERYYERRQGVQARTAARRRAEHEYTLDQIESVFAFEGLTA